ncbi:iron complex transport system substrate-binding protein [Kushneria sinocarnis]|uniref:Iron complex transport system substrate-binding protein n=1 Tax=Kushneria sinocarnis TaxID=595502 RepID=A0A420WWP1_9GAMM|nr:ABC transporter substrate-binding protein [Kushneria sinocarnis]RKR03535.1 iron complex transport system substrate-binding protein [Kushneria sinocarnis]
MAVHRRPHALALSALLLGGLLIGQAQADEQRPDPRSPASRTHYPLVIDNCGHELTFEQAPRRIVTLGQLESELLLSLGVADRIAGTAVWFGPVRPPLRQANQTVPRLSEDVPSFESVTRLRPDLVAAQFTYHLGAHGEVATRNQFEQLGIHTWVSPSDCLGKQVTESSNSDGSRSRPFTMAVIDQEITQLARILDVQARGQALIDRLHQRITRAKARLALPEGSDKPTVVYWFSSPRLQGDPWVAGNDGAPGVISRTLGLDNIIDSSQEWPAVSWERIATLDPDIIVIADMNRRRFPADDVRKKLDFLHHDPVARELDAVEQGHIITVGAQGLNPSMRVVDAIETIGRQLADFRAADS